MTEKYKEVLEKVKTSNDMNTWILSLLSLPIDDIKKIAKNKTVPAMVAILGDVITDESINKLNKFKILSDYIKTSIEEDTAPPIHTLQLRIIDPKDVVIKQ